MAAKLTALVGSVGPPLGLALAAALLATVLATALSAASSAALCNPRRALLRMGRLQWHRARRRRPQRPPDRRAERLDRLHR